MIGVAVLSAVTVVWAGQSLPPSPATDWAREEYATYTKAVFGFTPPVKFVLPGEAAEFAADFAALKGTDGYAVRLKNGVITFIADCSKGHVNGVHRWLERNSDIIWPRPMDDMCCFTPQAKTLGELQCDYLDKPAFLLRYFGGGAPAGASRRYLARNAVSPVASLANLKGDDLNDALRYGTVGAYCDVWGGGHDMETRWFPRAEFFKDHPEYWMLIDGVRWEGDHSNFCETNPDFVRAFTRSVEEKTAHLPPSVKIVSINMEDTSLTCECTNCLKPITLPDGTKLTKDDPAFRSTRFFIFFNEFARHFAQTHPDLKILQFAYVHLAVPAKVRIEPNVILKFCPYPRNMREGVIDGASNAKWRARIDEWLANTPEMYWREYYFCGNIYYPRPIADTAAKDLRYIRDRGVKYVYTDSPGRGGDSNKNNAMYGLNRPHREFYDMNGMEAWVIQKLFWDPSLDPETLRATFLRRTFGPAADDVATFYRLLRESWYSDDFASGFSDDPFRSAAHYIVGKKLSDKCTTALAAAAARADTAARRDWIAAMRKTLADWIAAAPNYLMSELVVPRVPTREEPSFDFDGSDWAKAFTLPDFRLLRSKVVDGSGSKVKVFADARALYFGFDIKKPGVPLYAVDALPKGAFPKGDKVELGFDTGSGGYVHLASDWKGHRYQALGLQSGLDDTWTVRTQKTAEGWQAVVRVPFDVARIVPEQNPHVRLFAMISYNQGGMKASNVNFSLGTGVPHAPTSWMPLRIDTEAIHWVTDEEREAVRNRVYGIDGQPGTPEGDAKRFYSNLLSLS
jgi:hypothetical protein